MAAAPCLPGEINIHEQIYAWRRVLVERHECRWQRSPMKAAGALLSQPAPNRTGSLSPMRSSPSAAVRHLQRPERLGGSIARCRMRPNKPSTAGTREPGSEAMSSRGRLSWLRSEPNRPVWTGRCPWFPRSMTTRGVAADTFKESAPDGGVFLDGRPPATPWRQSGQRSRGQGVCSTVPEITRQPGDRRRGCGAGLADVDFASSEQLFASRRRAPSS